MENEIEKKQIFNQVADDLKKYIGKDTIQCPNCLKIFEWDNANYNPEERTYTCPHCLNCSDEDEFGHFSMYDYIQEIYQNYKEKYNEINSTKP